MTKNIAVGDLVTALHSEDESSGIVLRTYVNMWGEEVIPSGVEVLWCSSEIEVWPEDELEVTCFANDSN